MKLSILKIAIMCLPGGDIDIMKGLPSLTALTLYIQTAPAERIVITNVGFQVLTYFKFMCPAPCLSFEQGAMPKVQKLKLGFNSNQMEPDSLEIAGFLNLTSLVDVCAKFGVQDAEEFDIKAAESALEAAVSNHPNISIIRVLCSDMIFHCEEDKITVTEGREDTSMKKQHEIREGKKKSIEDSENHVIKQVSNSRTRYSRTNSNCTPYAQSVDLVTGAMDSLLPKLMHLQSLHKDLLEDIESLYKELQAIQAHLRDTVEVQPDQREVWAKEIRDLSYDAEDTIDSFLVQVHGSEPDTKQDGIVEIFRRVIRRRQSRSKSQKILEFRSAINDIIGMVHDVVSRSRSYKLRNEDHFVANPIATSSSAPLLSALNEEPREMVGIEVSRDEVIRKLRMKYDTTQLDIVSIVGMGGLGKTTLAKLVYDWAEGQFDCRAFVSVSQQPNMERVFMDILIQIDREKYMNINAATLNESLLIKELRGLLADKRYFVVIDDIWNIQSWEKIKSALIDNRNGSKVITTSRILSVAAKAAGEVYMLKPLSTELSRELFNITLFGGKGKCPTDLLEVSEEIVRKCGGLPLAITTVAKLLVGKSIDEWSKMSYCLDGGYEYNEGLVNMRSILLSSYYDMPYHLRIFLLYLHIFPKYSAIKKETLIWKWVAEGFIGEKPETRLFELGERYFNELIDRSLIVPIKDQHHGIIVGCHVHYMVLDFIGSISLEEDFVTVLDDEQDTSSQASVRRLAIKNRDAELYDPLDNTPIGQVRSFNATMCRFSMALSLSRFEVLRVLAIEECIFTEGQPYHLDHIGRLVQLRYLGLYNTHIWELPGEVGNLSFLQTLDVRGTGIRELPHGVCQLSQLMCLLADDASTRVPDWIGELTSLEKLQLGGVGRSVKFLKELGKLTQLRELEIGTERFDENSNKALVESMGNLRKLQVLALVSSEPGEEANWEGFVPPRRLRDLRMKIASSRVPAWINPSVVPDLSHLSVDVKAVEKEDLTTLGRLQGLVSLQLLTPSNVFPTIEGDGAFPRLRYFGTSAPVMFLPGAMPCLESFRFKVDEPTPEADFVISSLGNLSLLQKVEVEISSSVGLDVEAVQEALKHAVDKHLNSPNLDVIKTDQVEITC